MMPAGWYEDQSVAHVIGIGSRMIGSAVASGASAAEKKALFSGTAMRVYNLGRLPEALAVKV